MAVDPEVTKLMGQDARQVPIVRYNIGLDPDLSFSSVLGARAGITGIDKTVNRNGGVRSALDKLGAPVHGGCAPGCGCSVCALSYAIRQGGGNFDRVGRRIGAPSETEQKNRPDDEQKPEAQPTDPFVHFV